MSTWKMESKKAVKKKVTLSIEDHYVTLSKNMSRSQNRSLSSLLMEKILEGMENETNVFNQTIDGLKNLVPAAKKRTNSANWKDEIQESIKL